MTKHSVDDVIRISDCPGWERDSKYERWAHERSGGSAVYKFEYEVVPDALDSIDIPITDTVIVCTRNRPNELQNMMRQLNDQQSAGMAVIVVDASDRPHFVRMCCANASGRHPIIAVHTQPGLPRQRNLGVRIALSHFGDSLKALHFLDDDVLIDSTYVGDMSSFLATHPEVVLAAPRDLHLQERSTRTLRTRVLKKRSGRVLRTGQAIPPYLIDECTYLEWVPGLAQSFPREVFRSFHFNDQARLYGEDIDACLRISLLGKIAMTDHIHVRHSPSSIERTSLPDVANQILQMRLVWAKEFPDRVSIRAVRGWSLALSVWHFTNLLAKSSSSRSHHLLLAKVYLSFFRRNMGLKKDQVGSIHEGPDSGM